MSKNPYKYRGPLDPEKNNLVCVHRSDDVNRVIEGILAGDYWVVVGSKQIGKSTFLRQIKFEFPDAYYIYFDFGFLHSDDWSFYRELIKTILNKIPSEQTGQLQAFMDNREGASPEFGFYRFLEKFKAKDENKKIILLFDEIDNLPSLRTFLHIWRKVYHERYEKETLNQYAVIITGSVDLIALTDGLTSPFNIAEILYLKDFSDEESEKLIDHPMRQLDIGIEPDVKRYLISQVNGHPQLLQRICHILVDAAKRKKKKHIILTKQDIHNAIEILFKESCLTLDTLRREIKINDILAYLIKETLMGKKKKYYPYKEFSIYGVGAIVEVEGFCAIRNRIFETFLKHIPEVSPPPPKEPEKRQKKKPDIFISYSHRDDKWRKLLYKHLAVLEYQEILFAWDDHKLEAGQDWYQEIERKLNTADIAIFLISANSLTSDFILKKEIPTLLKRKKREGLIIFPVLVRHCSWKKVRWLAGMMIRPRDGIPISEGGKNQRDKKCVEIVDEITDMLEKKGILS